MIGRAFYKQISSIVGKCEEELSTIESDLIRGDHSLSVWCNNLNYKN